MDGSGAEKDALAGEGSGAGGTGVRIEGETEREVGGVADADAGGGEDMADTKAVVEHLKRRGRVKKIEAVVRGAREGKRLAEAAGAGGEQARGGVGLKAAVVGHAVETCERFEGAEQDAAAAALYFAGEIHAVVAAVDEVEIGVAGRTEENAVAPGGAAMRMGRGVGARIVRAEVSFDLDDAAGEPAEASAVRKDFAEETRSDALGRGFEEGAVKGAAG